MSDEALKQAYAEAYLKTPDDPYAAAVAVFAGDTARALIVSREWPHDADVIAHMDTLKETLGDDAFLPDKATTARAIYALAESTRVDPKDRLAAYKLYAELRDFIPKPGTTVNNNTLVDNRKVMVVTDHGTDAEWEAKARAQQAKLIEDAARPIAVN